MLSVFKIEKLDPSVVRRVTEEELYDLKPYDFVKVSFELPAGMEVEKAKEDVKQVLSPNAKVFPLVTTKRLLVMDSVANLRLVSALLNEERVVQDGRIVPTEFVLKHARPEKVIDILYVVLGLDPQSRPTQMELQLQQQKLQLMTQMQQQGKDVIVDAQEGRPAGVPGLQQAAQQRHGQRPAGADEDHRADDQVSGRAVWRRRNRRRSASAATGPVAERWSAEMRKYPLTTLDPDNFVMTLEEIGGLSPSAEFRVDKKSKTLFATGHRIRPREDRQPDRSVRRLGPRVSRDLRCGGCRPTRWRPPIYNLMAGQAEEEDDNNAGRYWYYDPWEQEPRERQTGQGLRRRCRHREQPAHAVGERGRDRTRAATCS